MRNIWLVMKNNLYRFTRNKTVVAIILILLPVIVSLGIYFGQLDSIKGNIAVVGVKAEQEKALKETLKSNDKVSFEFLDESPTRTELIKGIYLAEINFDGGEPKVISYGKEEVKLTLEAALKGEVYEGKADDTTVLGKIVGFLTMFLIMGAVMMMDFFLIDRKNKVYTRVLSGTVSYYQYILGQLFYAISLLAIPTIIMSVGVVKLLNIDLGISMLGFAGLILLICTVCTAYAIFICNIFKSDLTANMTSGNLAMFTSIFAGCVINITDTNKVIGFLRDFLPQKRLIDLANNYNNNDLIFLVFIIVLFIGIGVAVGKKYYENGEFA